MINWPPHSNIVCFNSSGQIIAKSKRSKLDLSDSLMLWRDSPLFCSIQVSTKDANWNTWNSENILKIEEHITYDLKFDGYKVKIERVSSPGKTLCGKPFEWNLEIAVDYGEEVPESNPVRRYPGSRFKVARDDASVKTIQTTIENIFGLPHGCVCLLTPKKNKAKSKSSIKSLRARWGNS